MWKIRTTSLINRFLTVVWKTLKAEISFSDATFVIKSASTHADFYSSAAFCGLVKLQLLPSGDCKNNDDID